MFKNLLIVSILLLGSLVSRGQWVSTGGPNSGPNRCLAISDKNIFLGTWQPRGGIFHSVDNGTNWTLLDIGVTGPNVNVITINGSNIFAGLYGGVYRSADNGANWTSASSGLTNTDVASIAISGTNLFCGTYKGVFHSTNNGSNWTAANNGFPTGGSTFIVFGLSIIDTNIFAGIDGYGVFRSTDNGDNWTEKNSGLADKRVFCLASMGTNLFAGTLTGVYSSSDYGETWIKNQGFAGKTVNTLAVSGTTIFGGSSNGDIRFSTDNGSTWTPASNGMQSEIVYALAAGESNIFAGTSEGVVYKRKLSEMIPVLEIPTNKSMSGFKLQNYPNPFNSSTTISWHSSESGKQTLKVYGFHGNEVATLVDEFKPAGDYKVVFNATNLSGGVYFYTLQNDQFFSTNKMILSK